MPLNCDAVVKQHTNEAALGIDGSSLFHHQHGQQAVGDQEQNGQHGKERAPGLAGRVIARQSSTNRTPIYLPLINRRSYGMQLASQ